MVQVHVQTPVNYSSMTPNAISTKTRQHGNVTGRLPSLCWTHVVSGGSFYNVSPATYSGQTTDYDDLPWSSFDITILLIP